MLPLIAAAFVTPVWGFALQPPTLAAIDPAPLADVRGVVVATPPSDEEPPPEFDHTTMDFTSHFQLGATVAMAVTGMMGFIQFGDEYGFHARYADTACANGNAVLSTCGSSTPAGHLAAAVTTAGLGLTAFILSTQVDFDAASRVDSDWRIYEVTRWIGMGMFVVQAVGGFLLANAVRFGWADEQHDFGTLEGLATAHMAWGAATLALETANTILVF